MVSAVTLSFRLLFLGLLFAVVAADGQPFGLSNRIGVTTLKLPLTPPVTGYLTTNAFGNVTFTDPLVIRAPPGETNRLFIAEQNGVIAVITNLAAPNRTVFLDISGVVRGGVPPGEEGLLGFTFHPGYATNGWFYVYYSVDATTVAAGRHQRLSRFQVSAANPNQAAAVPELPILTMYDEAGNHNGGDLHFGPDGYLYVSMGDEGDANDTRNNTQIIDKDFWAGMLRIDVNIDAPPGPGTVMPNPHPANTNTPGGMINYRIPADNPFVGVTTWYGSNLVPARVRTEFYAIGLRNPWRFSFDPPTGFLYCGDVGQNAREEIDIIRKGGNYGWAFREGFNAGPKAAPVGAVRIDPILDYGRGSGTNQGTSVTGGVVYRGDRIPALQGAYVFADYVSGNVWSLRYNGTNATGWTRLTGNINVGGFGTDPRNGDILLADQNNDTIKRLIQVTSSGAPFPATLAETGAFTNTATLTPHAGIQPYDLNLPSWSDNAIMSRWFYVPTNRQVIFRATNNWSFPTGSVWIQHFELELTNGAPASRKRLETRFLVRDAFSEVYGITYRWDSATNATRVPDGGLDESFVINDAGTQRTQVWHYPSRDECLRCHTTFGGQAVGFNTPQLNRDFNYSGVLDNQLRAFANAGYFIGASNALNSLRALAHPSDESASVEQRVRSWLAVNCAGCHQPNAPGGGSFDARLFAPLSQTRLVNGTLNNTGGDPSNRVVVPGDPAHSMLLTRITNRGPNQMPPLPSALVDPEAVALITRWITNDLPAYRTFPQWQLLYFAATNTPNALAAADPDTDGSSNSEEYLTGTNPTNALSFWSIGLGQDGDTATISFPRLPNRGIEVQWNSNLGNPSLWQFLDVPANRPFIAATNGTSLVPDSIGITPTKFYRARVFEP